MMQNYPIQVYSEIGKLKKVLLKRPGEELENLTPDLLPRLLFDDIPYLKVAQEEHDAFASTLKSLGVEVFYLEDLVVESISNPQVRSDFIDDFIKEAGLRSEIQKQVLKDYLSSMSDKEMVLKMMAGIYKQELPNYQKSSLASLINQDYPFVADPMPNLIFTRDPFASLGRGVSLHHMQTEVRRRETLFSQYIFKYHPTFGNDRVPLYYHRDDQFSLEGGDILVLNDKVLAVGVSQRTESSAVDLLSRHLFSDNTSFETILALQIPSTRSFMHLDTVFTHINKGMFTIHPKIEGPLSVFKLTKDPSARHGVKVVQEHSKLEDILKEALGLDKVELIRCAGGHPVASEREQWNDGTNTLAISPGEVVVYNRNHVTNKILKDKGLKVHEIPSSELSRGRGGPRCMSMPLEREKI